MTISIKPTASGSTIEQDGSTILTVDGSGNITPTNGLYPKGPAFSAYASADQTLIDGVWTKVAIDTERYDTDSCFDSTTNYRFTPTVAGYYQVNIVVRLTGATFTFRAGGIYKNSEKYSALSVNRETINAPVVLSGSDLIYMNGTTDYLECFAIAGVSSGTPILDYNSTTDTSYFSAYLARAA